jgi:hypothetical protein
VQITATQATNTNYLQATATATLTAVKGTQALTFNNIYKNENSDPFVPVISTSANPSYSSYTFSVPEGNGVASTDGSVITVLGMGTVEITATQAQNSLYNSASTTTTLKVISKLKRAQINLWDSSTDTERFIWSQHLDHTRGFFQEQVNFRDVEKNVIVEDVLERLYRQDIIDSNIIILTDRTVKEEKDNQALSERFREDELNIDLIEMRASQIDIRLMNIEQRESLVETETEILQTRIQNLEEALVLNELQIQEIEFDKQVLDNRTSIIEQEQIQYESRLDSVESQIQQYEIIRLETVENDIEELTMRLSTQESDILQLEHRNSLLESDIAQFESITESILERIEQNEVRENEIENHLSALDSRQDIHESNIMALDTRMSLNEGVTNDIRQALFMITDGNLVDQFSTLQNITEQFNNTANGQEDLLDLYERMIYVDSVLQLLLEEQL